MLTKLYKPREFDKERGFTLIELLVVIVIIGILAAIALPIFLNQQKAAMNATVQSDARNSVIGVRAALVKTPDAGGFTLLHAGDTASYALIQSPLAHAANVTVPAGNIGVYMVETKDNVSVMTDTTHKGDTALTQLSSAAPNWQSWVVHSENKKTGYWYEFDSTTGKYTDGTNPTPVGDAYVPSDTTTGSSGGGSTGGGGTGNNAGEITATDAFFIQGSILFESPVSNNTSDLPWAVGKDLTSSPQSTTIDELHVYVGSTEVPLSAASNLSNWYLVANDWYYGSGLTISYDYASDADFLTDITAAGFTMEQFYTTGKIVGTVDGIPNNVMHMGIVNDSTQGTPTAGYPGAAGPVTPVDYTNWGTQGTSAISISKNAFHNGSQPDIARFGFANSDFGTDGSFPHQASQDPRLGDIGTTGNVQITHFYTVVNGTYTEMTLHNPNNISFKGGTSIDTNGNVHWSVYSDNGNGQGANAGGFYVTDPNGNRTDPTTGREYADTVIGYSGSNGFYGDANTTAWDVVVVFRFPGATEDFWTHQVPQTVLN